MSEEERGSTAQTKPYLFLDLGTHVLLLDFLFVEDLDRHLLASFRVNGKLYPAQEISHNQHRSTTVNFASQQLGATVSRLRMRLRMRLPK